MNKSNKELERLGIKILNMARTELYLAMRYLYPALDRLTPTSDMRVKFLATDGSRLYFMPLFTVKKYKENPVSINRAYLHSVLHCLFGHFHRHEGRREDLWSLACDIMVEGIIDKLEFSCVETVIPPLKEDTEERILKKVKL